MLYNYCIRKEKGVKIMEEIKSEKMEIVSFTYCEDVQNDPQGKPMIIGPMQHMLVINFPTNYSFCASFGIFNIPKEGFLIKFDFVDPDGNVVQGAMNNMMVPPIPENQIQNPNIPLGIQVNMGFRNIILTKAGRYCANIYLNGKFIQSYPIEVLLNAN